MKLCKRFLSSNASVLGLLLFTAMAAMAGAAQSITFSPAEKLLRFPAGAAPSFSITSDAAGNLFFPGVPQAGSDTAVVKVSPNGVVTTVASGFICAEDVKLDAAGNVYVADPCNNNLVKVTPSGGKTVVSSGLNIASSGSNGDFAVDSSGNIYISDAINNQVLKVTPKGSKTTLATGFAPAGIGVDANANVYVSDDTNSRVIKIAPSGALTVLASGLNTPLALALDSSANLYVVNFISLNGFANTDRAPVLKISQSGATTNLYDGADEHGGVPDSVAVDGAGNVYVLERDGSVVELQNTTIATGDVNFGSVLTAFFDRTEGVQVNPPVQPVTFTFHATTTVASIQVLTNGAPNLDFQSVSGGTCTTQTYNAGQTCTVNVQYLPTHAGIRTGAVLLQDSAGSVLSTVNLQGVGYEFAFALDPGVPNALPISGLKDPSAVAVDGLGNIFAVDKGNDRVIRLAADGTQTIFGSGLISPTGAVIDGAGDIYVSDTGNDRIVKISPTGRQTTVLTGLNTPDGVTLDGAGNLYVADSGNNRVVKLAVDGVTQSTVGSGYSRPTGVAVDALGNVFVADFGNNQIVKVTPGGVQSTVISGLAGPAGVSIDIAGDLYIPEVNANDVLMIQPFFSTRPRTIVSSGLNFPFDAVLVAVDTGGNVFVADTLNNRVLQVDRSNASVNFGAVTVGQTSPSQTVTLSQIIPLVDTCCGAGPSPGALFSDSTDFKQATLSASCGRKFSNDQCFMVLTFTPQSIGTKTGTATINSTEMQVPAVIHLSGTGQ